MKNFKFYSWAIWLVLCVSFFSSCSKDDDVNENSIVGLWVFVNVTADIQHPTDSAAVKSEKANLTFASLFLQGSTIEFKSDKTFVLTVVGEKQTGSYTNSGDHFTLTVNGETVDSDDMLSAGASVSLKGGVLTISTNNLDAEYEYYDEDGKMITTTYRNAGFTKYEVKMTFKK